MSEGQPWDYFDRYMEDDEDPLWISPDQKINRQEYLKWRSPRMGKSNPERATNLVWTWLARTRMDAFTANEHFNGPDSCEAGPAWSARRFGQSITLLPDGRVIFVAGEHEDDYDSDFYIYNDVFVLYPDKGFDVYIYPRSIFPPTDFHSATLVGDQIILIGNLSYPDQRQEGITQVLSLSTRDFSIQSIHAGGEAPGWINRHAANLSEDRSSIIVSRGLVFHKQSYLENVDDWSLDLNTWQWSRLTTHSVQRWVIKRQDNKYIRRFQTEDLSLSILNSYYQNVKPIRDGRMISVNIDDAIVRCTYEFSRVYLVIEGELPEKVIESLISDLIHRMGKIENTLCVANQQICS